MRLKAARGPEISVCRIAGHPDAEDSQSTAAATGIMEENRMRTRATPIHN